VTRERGGLYAFAHVRGGDDFGYDWYQAGYQRTKPNTWTDFIACAEYSINHKYTSVQGLAGTRGSAGGVLIGRALKVRSTQSTLPAQQLPLTSSKASPILPLSRSRRFRP